MYYYFKIIYTFDNSVVFNSKSMGRIGLFKNPGTAQVLGNQLIVYSILDTNKHKAVAARDGEEDHEPLPF